MKALICILLFIICFNKAGAQHKLSSKERYTIYIEKSDTANKTLKPTQFKFVVQDDTGRNYTLYELVINGVRLRNTNIVTPFIVEVAPNQRYFIKCVAMLYESVYLPPINIVNGETVAVKIILKADETPIKD
ncbi:hypothetical protein EWM62_07950 [Mucilaginibacter terrigena]|uniref:Uncharacterized protein n=1 Tax=Mucilaginibacter terrigena TaxID=2492395 RepID=A0A4Q5LLY0_9SPHI|nr:hypothetical protein [Mucilaginibacter terrigena]RYU90577.1 hypothetical protein EWM62_07950 [Mucilaginibacter terrigena]